MRLIRPSRLLLPVAALFAANAASAQQAPYVIPEPGTRVRVTTEGFRYPGWVQDMRADTLLFRLPGMALSDTVLIPLAAVQRLDISQGRSRRVGAEQGGRIGAIAGMVMGAVVYVALAGVYPAHGGAWAVDAPLAAVYYGAASALLGGIIGFAPPPREKWRQVYIRRNSRRSIGT